MERGRGEKTEDGVMRASEIEAEERTKTQRNSDRKRKTVKERSQLSKGATGDKSHNEPNKHSGCFLLQSLSSKSTLLPINLDTDFQYSFTNLAALEAFNKHSFHNALYQFKHFLFLCVHLDMNYSFSRK